MNENEMLDQIKKAQGVHDAMAKSHPALVRGLVRCGTCKREKKADSAACLRSGWPKCCGYTMTLVS